LYYCLAYFPKVETDRINKIRQRYDPTYNLVSPHLTVIFPVPSSVGKKRIINHIDTVLKNWRPFQIHFGGLKKSWDHWLFLTLKNGESEIKRLSKELYSGFLSEYYRDDLEFIPHIGIGLFIKNNSQYDYKNPQQLTFDDKTYQQALSEAESIGFDFKCIINNLELLELNDDFTRIRPIKKFVLEGCGT